MLTQFSDLTQVERQLLALQAQVQAAWAEDPRYHQDLTYVMRQQLRARWLEIYEALKNGTDEYVCPHDCDICHGDDCPCDRLGCEGFNDK
jgi:hypothetical protein